MIRPMHPHEEADVRSLYALCHPRWRARPHGWFTAFPTLVKPSKKHIIASTSFYVSWPPTKDFSTMEYVMWGHDVCVHPEHRGRGIGLELCEARFRFAKDLGIRFFIGMTWPGNAPMIRIFERLGCVLSPGLIVNAYPDNLPIDRTGRMYTKGL